MGARKQQQHSHAAGVPGPPVLVSSALPAPAPPPTLTWSATWVSQGGREPGHGGDARASVPKPNQDSFIVEDAWWFPGAAASLAGGGGGWGGGGGTPGGGHRRSLSDFAGGAASYYPPPGAGAGAPAMAPNPLALWAAFDGHGPRGGAASDLARRRFPPALAAALARGMAPGPALAAALASVDADLLAGPCRACGVSGSTGVAALATARPPALHIAWVGDSRAVLARRRLLSAVVGVAGVGGGGGDWAGGASPAAADGRWSLRGVVAGRGGGGGSSASTPRAATVAAASPKPPPPPASGWAAAPAGLTAIELTFDHKPSTPAERARIEAAGGRVQRLVDPDTGAEVGPARVWLATAWAPGLAMSRSLGDALARSVGVCAAADTACVDLSAADAFAVVATDGVWEFMSAQDAVDCVARAPSPAAGCAALVAEARRRGGVEEASGSVDDITAVVVSLDVSAGGCGGGGGGGGGGKGGLDRAGST